MAPSWSNVVFEKELIFHEFDFETSVSEIEVSESTQICVKLRRVFFISFIHNFDDQLSSNCHMFVFIHVEIHQVGRLVFDNYQ